MAQLLDAACAGNSHPLVDIESKLWIAAMLCKAECKNSCVFDRLGGSLGIEGEHRMRGVTEQCDPSLTPSRERCTIEQCPAAGPARVLDQFKQARVPAA